ncbi:MAG: AAA family ATPase [Anaerolineae bacterium]|nr:AAA family ATPase [Anaerolineae bacterium]
MTQKKTNQELLKIALTWKRFGMDVIPDHPGKKYPFGIEGWQAKDFTENDLRHWIGRGYVIGLRNQEGLDFDNGGKPSADELFTGWRDLVEQTTPGLVDRLIIEKTKNAGYHVAWKCPVIDGNQKLATDGNGTTLIETRGQGGQFVVAPSPGYEVIQGSWPNLAEITPEERRILLDCAKAFDAPTPEPPRAHQSHQNGDNDRPGDIYNQKHAGEALDLLKREGWAEVYRRGDTVYLRRPGKDRGVSATFDYAGSNLFYPFSTNSSPFETETSYSPFAVFATLQHGSNFEAAAKDLAQRFGMNSNEPGSVLNVPENEADKNRAALFPHFTLSQGLVLPDSDYLIYGAIERGDIGMTYGDAAAGKTYVSIDLAVSLAAGLPWMGKWKVKHPFSVLYFIAEGRKKFFRRVLAAVNGMAERGADVGEVYRLVNDNLEIVTEVPQLFTQEASRYVTHYVDLWQQMGSPAVDIVFIDTLHRASVGSEENSSKDAGIVVEAITWMQRQLNCAANFVHHSNKSGGYRGSTAYRGNVDFVFKVEGLHREPRILTIDKLRDGEPDGPIEGLPNVAKFKVDDQSQGTYTTWLSGGDALECLPQKKPSKKQQAKSEVIEILTKRPGESKNALAQLVTSASKNTTATALEEMIADGEIITKSGAKNSYECYLPDFG